MASLQMTEGGFFIFGVCPNYFEPLELELGSIKKPIVHDREQWAFLL
jgi:hypothetical protein